MTRAISRLALTMLAAVSACAVGPDYQRPEAAVPAAYKETNGWKPSEPQDLASRGAWWSIYDDAVLDGLARQIEISNQTLKAAEAAFRQARAIVGEGRASFFPTVTLDVWGRIRRTVESDVAGAQASAADLAAARLSAQATLVTDYFQLRIDDELKRLLDDTVEAFARALQITQNRYAQGISARSDVASAQAQLEQTRSQAINVGIQRAQLEHAIAVLIGKPPAEFAIAPVPLKTVVPVMPPGLPSTLLERRPDIAAAERRMQAANAQIGVAVAAYFPTLTLSGSYGFVSSALDTLLRASNAVWSFGPQLAETAFDGGLRAAQVEAARATYDQNVADYRQTVLAGFQQVEDELAALRILEQQAAVQDAAVRAAQEAERLIFNPYVAGTVAYTSVITAQTTALADRQNALTILQNRLVASTVLVEALGGGWSAPELPTREQIIGDAPGY